MPIIPYRFFKVSTVVFFAFMLMLILSACDRNNGEAVTSLTYSDSLSDAPESTTLQQSTESTLSDDGVDAYVIFADGKTTINGNGVTFENNILTITQGGIYRLAGTLTDGKIYINSPDENKKVKLLLSGVSVSCSGDAPIYIENSPDETVLILEEGSVNSFSDTAREIPADSTDYATAAIYSKDDLQIEGSGTLNVNGNFGKGIFSKNDIDIHGGIININAVDDGIRGKESVEIEGGTLNIVCGGDGIRTNEDTDIEKGYINISSGTVNIESKLDGIQATSDVVIAAGVLSVKSGGGATGAYDGTYESFAPFGGGRHPESSIYSDNETDAASTKGIKADKSITVSGGSIYVDSLDDSIHSPIVTVGGGDLRLKSDDDGIHADELVTVTDGQLAVTQSYEGVEGRNIDIIGGTLVVNSSDDGFNAASSDSSGADAANFMNFSLLNFRGNPGGMTDYDSSCNIDVSGGTVIIIAQGDGVDSNGSVTMTGGRMIVYGPTNGGNGALDYGGSFTVSGGTLLAAGSAGMAQSVTGDGVEVLNFYADGTENTVYAVTDNSRNCILAFTSVKRFESVVLASDRISQNESYSFFSGGSVSDYTENIYGICFDGVHSGGTLEAALS